LSNPPPTALYPDGQLAVTAVSSKALIRTGTCLVVHQQHELQAARVRAVLGANLLEQHRRTEAESLLVSAYDTLSARSPRDLFLPLAAGRLLRLYTEEHRPADAARYRAR
jgi:hypothetical protein